MRRRLTRVGAVLVLTLLGTSLDAQIPMPDAREMSGIPRPVTDLPDRTVSIRLIRGELSNNIVDHPVELVIDGDVRTARTDEQGRAQFGPLPPGATLKAVATVDGERLESMEFPAPSQGGIRLMLVATDPARAAAARAPAVPGEVSLAGQTRFVIEPDDELIRVYYLMEIVNPAATPVEPSTPFVFETPAQARSTTVMEGQPVAAAAGRRVTISGPFQPGSTVVSVAYALPAARGEAVIEQTFPVTLQHLGVIVEKVGNPRVSSPQIQRQQEMPVGSRMYVAAAGGAVPAGSPLQITITGLPHHSQAPRWIALGLALAIVAVGAWLAWRPGPEAGDQSELKGLLVRREKLLQELVRLESNNQRGQVDEREYVARRERLMASLEHIYGALDSDDAGPGPASRSGLAA